MENKKNFYTQYNTIYEDLEKKIITVKCVTAKRALLPFPNMPFIDDIDDNYYKDLILEISNNDELFFIGLPTSRYDSGESVDGLNKVGSVCKIECVNVKDTGVNFICNVLYRARIREVYRDNNITNVTVEPLDEMNSKTDVAMILLDKAKKVFFDYIEFSNKKVTADLNNYLNVCDEPNIVVNLLAVSTELSLKEQYALLSNIDTEKRLEDIVVFLNKQINLENINRKINARIREENDKRQKEAYIKEKIKYLNDELDDGSEINVIEKNAREKLAKNQAALDFTLKQIEKLKKTPTMSPDYTVLRNHIDVILDLPWDKQTVDNIDLKQAKTILDEDHYGLDKVKNRILEYLAVLKLNKKITGQILCLVGAPGVGKTSIVKSIAKSLNRKFTKITLGGMHDESEIRGHRKTFVGAMPGRIMHNLTLANVNNPVFLLDEIDKISKSIHGDPASALLEVLDPEQNNNFKDNYIEVPFDLSNVLFIATANYIQNIPEALLDRMEIIHVDSYLTYEKFNIAKDYLIKKECAKNGIPMEAINISDELIIEIIDKYTYEAGVRELERLIAKLCRHIALMRVAEDENYVLEVNSDNLSKILDMAPVSKDGKREKAEVGIGSGLGWSQYGGSILTIECMAMEGGSGKFELTGNLQDVMKESAKISLTTATKFALAKSKNLNLKDINKKNIYLNACSGGIKKDGPSAGVVMTLAIYSVLVNKKINNNFALTGEMNLTGNITAIGGLREKLYACVQNGIENVVVPKQNEKDVAFVPKTITEKLNIHYVDNFKQVIDLCIMK